MFYPILYLLIGAIWSTVCEVMADDLPEFEGGANSMFTRWVIGVLIWPVEVWFLIVEVMKEK